GYRRTGARRTAPATQEDPVYFPGSVFIDEPAHAGARYPGRAPAQLFRALGEHRATVARAAAPGEPEARFAGQVPAPVLRRAAAAAGDRAGPGAGARVCGVRRARLGAGRIGAGPGDQPFGRPAEVAAPDLSVYFARPERGAAPEPLGGRDVPGACGGNRHARRDLQHAAAPVYTRLDGGGAALFASQSGPGQGHAAVGRDSQPAVAA